MKLKKTIAHMQNHQHPGWKNQNTGQHKPDLAIVSKMFMSGSKTQNSSEEKHKRPINDSYKLYVYAVRLTALLCLSLSTYSP